MPQIRDLTDAMTGARRSVLYTPELLALAVSLADWPLDADAAARGRGALADLRQHA